LHNFWLAFGYHVRMCSNYRPPKSEALAQFGIELPGFTYGEAYPGSLGPFLGSVKPDAWLPGTFGLLPHWAEPKLAKMTYNARSETVAEKPSFRSAWRHRQLCVIPVQAFYEPCYESGKAVSWRIEREDGKPFGLAGLWESRTTKDGDPAWSFTMLTINADEHPLMHRFHKPGDEKRSVVVLDDDAWQDWLKADREEDVRGFLQQFDPGKFRATADPRIASSGKEGK
jgi:putative SOS response-associated peptidase YedK